MASEEIDAYINIRNGELSHDEIFYLIDSDENPQLDHIEYHNDIWEAWDSDGNHYTFKKRN